MSARQTAAALQLQRPPPCAPGSGGCPRLFRKNGHTCMRRKELPRCNVTPCAWHRPSLSGARPSNIRCVRSPPSPPGFAGLRAAQLHRHYMAGQQAALAHPRVSSMTLLEAATWRGEAWPCRGGRGRGEATATTSRCNSLHTSSCNSCAPPVHILGYMRLIATCAAGDAAAPADLARRPVLTATPRCARARGGVAGSADGQGRLLGWPAVLWFGAGCGLRKEAGWGKRHRGS